MEGIFYKEGIYVLIESNEEHNDCIYHYEYRGDEVFLFGRRVSIWRSNVEYNYQTTAYLTVDGIKIINTNDSNKQITSLPLAMITAHLNAIETNGVDAFLRNYKQSVEFFYEELKNLSQMKTEQLSSTQDDSKIKSLVSELEKLSNLLLSVLIVLFNLKINMTAGLENEKVMLVCQSILDSFA